MTLKAMNKYLLCKKIEESETPNKGILIIPDKNKTHSIVEVLSIGQVDKPERYFIGQKLIIHQFGGLNVKIDKENYIFVEENEVCGEMS